METKKQIRLDLDTFKMLVRFHLLEDDSDIFEIKKELGKKLDALVRHEKYTRYKMSKDPIERETARKEYLDAIGMNNDFRW